ncbi:MAG: SDR family oxidoreductase [Anaerolineales bacterium]
MILVVGATGQLGTAIVRRLVAANQPVRAFVRRGSKYQHLQGPGVEFAFGDLRDATSVDAACKGVDVVMATATVIVPEGRPYSFKSVDGDGYQTLIESCKKHKVKQFVMVSVPVTPHDEKVPAFKYKRLNEERLKQSGLNYTIFQSSLFMDDWFAFIGSTIPGRGAEAATIKRQFWFLKMFMGVVGNMIEGLNMALVAGSAKTRHAFVTVDNVADFMVKSVDHPKAQKALFQIGGPEILTWEQVVSTYGNVLGRKIKPLYAPNGVFRVARLLFAPFSEGASDILGLNWLVGYDTPYDVRELSSVFGVKLTTAEQFLNKKASLPA